MDRLMDLIEEGDPKKILSEEDLFPRFNRLVKYNLVVLKNEKVFLTKKGIKARNEGIDLFIKKEKLARIQDQYLESEKFKKNNKLFSKKLKTPKFIQWCILMFLIALASGSNLYHLKIRDYFKK